MSAKQMCEDCEQNVATVIRTDNEGQPYMVCSTCDPGPGCRPVIVREYHPAVPGLRRIPMIYARCPQCGWTQVGSGETDSYAKQEAQRHREQSLAALNGSN